MSNLTQDFRAIQYEDAIKRCLGGYRISLGFSVKSKGLSLMTNDSRTEDCNRLVVSATESTLYTLISDTPRVMLLPPLKVDLHQFNEFKSMLL